MEKRTESPALARWSAIVLTAIFFVYVFGTLGLTLITSHTDILKSVQMTPDMQKTLPEHPTVLDKLEARINGLTAGVADATYGKDELCYINSAFQRALGKRMVNTGTSSMITLNTGHLYDLVPYFDLKPNVNEIADVAQTRLKDYPFTFVYEHPTLYDDTMMPVDYAALDHSAEMADEVVATFRARGVDVIDSRDVIPYCGYPLNDLLMYTDQHWSTLAAIAMAQGITRHLNDTLGLGLDPSVLDRDALRTEVHEKLFLGKYGQRLGTRVIEPDDIVEYWPAEQPVIHRSTLRSTTYEDVTDTFRAAVTRSERLLPDPGRTWNILAYTYYGQTEAYSIFENASAPDKTILLIKDSYSSPIGTFLSLVARNVVCVDLRKDIEPIEYWLEKYEPDAVVIAYSLRMLQDHDYDLGGSPAGQ